MLRSNPRGSFIQKFEQLSSTVPLEYTSGDGFFGGYWVTLESKSIFQYETAIVFSVYACQTGHPMSMCISLASKNRNLALGDGSADVDAYLQILLHFMNRH